jgi:hypothetical protein
MPSGCPLRRGGGKDGFDKRLKGGAEWELKQSDRTPTVWTGRMKVEPGGTDADGFKRAKQLCGLILDFALVCLFVAVGS